MAYSEDFRIKVNEYLDAGHTQRDARDTFRISLATINSWRKRYVETGEVKDNPPNRSFRKVDPAKLKVYVAEHPDAYLQEIADDFGCTEGAIRKAFKRLGITRKKRVRVTGNNVLSK